MSHSTVQVDFVLVYFNELDKAVWLTKSRALRLLDANPHTEMICQYAPNFDAVAKLAGPKPEVYVKSTEDYNARKATETHTGSESDS